MSWIFWVTWPSAASQQTVHARHARQDNVATTREIRRIKKTHNNWRKQPNHASVHRPVFHLFHHFPRFVSILTVFFSFVPPIVALARLSSSVRLPFAPRLSFRSANIHTIRRGFLCASWAPEKDNEDAEYDAQRTVHTCTQPFDWPTHHRPISDDQHRVHGLIK